MIVSDERLRQAIDGAISYYWTDNRAQSEAYGAWVNSGYKGACEQHTKGTIADYVYAAVWALISTTPE